MTDQPAYALNQPTSPTSGFNSLKFAMEQAQNARMTGTIVQIKKVTTTGQVAGIGRVNVMPMVKMIDGVGQTVDHVQVYNLPYFRLVGGSKGIILDPKENDIGFVIVADRDISAVKQSKKASPPGSKRANNIADGVFVGCFLAEAPTSYVQFQDDGTIVISPDNGTTKVTVKANDVTVTIGTNTTLEVKPNEIKSKVGDIATYVSPGRIDLGKKNAPHAVTTADGDSLRVFAVINETD